MPEFEVDSIRGRRRLIRSGGDRDDRGWTLLHIYASKGDLKEVKRLLDEGMDVNVAAWGPKSHGVTPLHLAAKRGHLKVMDELLERGANIDARTKGACGCVDPTPQCS
ncbi:26S proteasome non-ATPase regulatory subunit 10-like isoform X2 [Sesamum indicum]|uniref:26S proteasome non-ATPase regulatory subunit 10-like isoform X2 n=1 Tax=Sesamum indicum TaxID=4182 RepID=A0A6I9TM92_SESIN|nr:26S proteasome non-ATPase regulatory subunit 10-like isoform X2 [Sesamum indicum]